MPNTIKIENKNKIIAFKGDDLFIFIDLERLHPAIDKSRHGSQFHYLPVKITQEVIAQFRRMFKTPLPPRIMITPIIPFARQITHLRFSFA